MSKRAKTTTSGASAPSEADSDNFLYGLLTIGVPDAALAVIKKLSAKDAVSTCDAFSIFPGLCVPWDTKLRSSELALAMLLARARRQMACKHCVLTPQRAIYGAADTHLLKGDVRREAERQTELIECRECDRQFCRHHAIKFCDRECEGGVGVCSETCRATVGAMRHDWPYRCTICFPCARAEAQNSSSVWTGYVTRQTLHVPSSLSTPFLLHRRLDIWEDELSFRKSQLKSARKAESAAEAVVVAAKAALAAPASAAAPPVSFLERALKKAQDACEKAQVRHMDADSATDFWKDAVRNAKAARIDLDLDDDHERGECPLCGFQMGAVPIAKEGDRDYESDGEGGEEDGLLEERVGAVA